MHSKNNRNNKKRFAYRHGEKMIIFLRRGIIFLSIVGFILIIVLGIKISAVTFYIRDIQVSGNYHLTKEDVIKSTNIEKGTNLLKLHSGDIDKELKSNPWIKKVSLRRQFPTALMIRIEEAVPKALLSLNDKMFLVDEDGNILEEIRDKGTPFLPVISGIDPVRDRRGFLEAMKLIEALINKGVVVNKESVEIGLEPYGLVMKIDGETLKIGYEGYSEKLKKWVELEPEIKKRGIAIMYVDLRFKDVIIKPVNTAKK